MHTAVAALILTLNLVLDVSSLSLPLKTGWLPGLLYCKINGQDKTVTRHEVYRQNTNLPELRAAHNNNQLCPPPWVRSVIFTFPFQMYQVGE